MRTKYICVDVSCDRKRKCAAPLLHERGNNGGAIRHGVGRTAKEAWAEVKKGGWKRVGDKDLCPYCLGTVSAQK